MSRKYYAPSALLHENCVQAYKSILRRLDDALIHMQSTSDNAYMISNEQYLFFRRNYTMQEVGDMIESIRKELGLSLGKLSKLIGLASIEPLSYYRRGLRFPSRKILGDIYRNTGYDVLKEMKQKYDR